MITRSFASICYLSSSKQRANSGCSSPTRALGITYSGEFGVIERGTDTLYGNSVPALYIVDLAFGSADEGYPVHQLDQRKAVDLVKEKGGFNTWRKPSKEGFFWSKRKNNIVYNLLQAM